MKKNYKNFIYNMIGSSVNAFVSLFLLIIVTRINGVKYAGIFSFAFSIACLFQVVATYSGRAYQVTERDKNLLDSDFIYTKITCCFFMIIISVLFLLIKKYNLEKNIILILLITFKLLESFIDVFYGIIQKNNDLYKVGISLFIKGFFGIIVFFVINVITHNLILSILGLIIVNVMCIIFYDLLNIKKYSFVLSKVDKSKIFKILKYGFFTFVITLLTQYLLSASKYSIDNFLSDKYQTIFGIIVMPATAIILCGQFIIHPFLTKLTEFLSSKNYKSFNILTIKLSISLVIIGLFASLIAYLLGMPVLQIIYGLKLNKYSLDLVIIVLGATLFGISYVISNSLIALRDTFSQVIIFFISSLFAYFISNILVFKYRIRGATLAYLLSMIILTILFLIYYVIKYIIKKDFKQVGDK